MAEILKLRIQLRRDTVANWIKYDPILLNGEAAVSSDLNKIKIGNGTSKWSELEYMDGEALNGLTEAPAGSYPVKQSDGSLKWIIPSAFSEEGIKATLDSHTEEIAAIKSSVKNTVIKIDNNQYNQTEDGSITIPLATLAKHGVVKGSEEENQVSISSDGTMIINDVNVDKLVQTAGDSFVLYGGNAETI